MRKATEAQTDVVTALPFESHEWDVFVGMHHAILDIQVSKRGGVLQSILTAAERLTWRCGGLMVSTLDSRSGVWAQAGDIVLCSWSRHFTLTVPLSTQVYKWVLVNLMLSVTLRWTSIPSRGS